MLKQVGIDKKISPDKSRYTCATNPLDTGAERVDFQALLGHECRANTPMDTHGEPKWMEQGVARW